MRQIVHFDFDFDAVVDERGVYTHTRDDRRRDCRRYRHRDDGRDSRPVYTLQAIVAATNICLIEQPTGNRRRDNRRDDR